MRKLKPERDWSFLRHNDVTRPPELIGALIGAMLGMAIFGSGAAMIFGLFIGLLVHFFIRQLR